MTVFARVGSLIRSGGLGLARRSRFSTCVQSSSRPGASRPFLFPDIKNPRYLPTVSIALHPPKRPRSTRHTTDGHERLYSAVSTMAPIPDVVQLVDQAIADNKVMMFSKSYCPFCNKVKDLFKQLNISYMDEVHLDCNPKEDTLEAMESDISSDLDDNTNNEYQVHTFSEWCELSKMKAKNEMNPSKNNSQKLATISSHEFDFEEALEILSRNEVLEDGLDSAKNNHKVLKQLMTETNYIAKDNLQKDFENSKVIVNPFLKNHYIDGNGKIFVESLDKAIRIAKNGDSIFLKNGEHNLEQTEKDGKVVTILKKNVTIIGESTNESILNLSRSITMADVQFRRLNIEVGPHPINVSGGRLSFASCLLDVCCRSCFVLDKGAEIDLDLCCFTTTANSAFICLGNSDSIIKINIKDCSFADFNFIIYKNCQMNLTCGFEFHAESCSFFGIKGAMIKILAHVSCMCCHKKDSMLTYPTSVVIRNCFVEVLSSIENSSLMIDINNACHVLIESTKFNSKIGYPPVTERGELVTNNQVNTGLRFADIQCVEIANTTVSREGNGSTLASLQTYLEKAPKEEGSLEDAAIHLMAVHEATIRDSIFEGFYYGITTKSSLKEVSKVDNVCFTGVYNCQVSNMAVCFLLDSRLTGRSIFALSDISLRDSLVGVRVSEACCRNGSVDVLDVKFTNIASPIVVPKVLKLAACGVKDQKKNLISRLEMKNIAFPDGGFRENVSRKKRRDNVIRKLMKAGVLDSTVSIPYMEIIFKSKGDCLEIANEDDLETFDFQVASDYQWDCDDSVD